MKTKKSTGKTSKPQNPGNKDRNTGKTINIDPDSAQRVLNQILDTLARPEYQDQVKRFAQDSLSSSLQTLRGVNSVSSTLMKMDQQGIEGVIKDSSDDLVKAYLQFTSDLLVLLQRLSARTIEIIDSSTK